MGHAQSQEAAALDAAIARLSARLVAAEGDELQHGIVDGLGDIGAALACDHAWLGLLGADAEEPPLLLEWHDPAQRALGREVLPTDPAEARWWIYNLLDGAQLVITSVARDVIDNDRVAERLRRNDVGALAVVPVVIARRVRGFVGVSTTAEERAFSEHAVAMLRVVGETSANAVARDRAMRALVEATGELERRNQELIRSNRDLEAFAYVASHDLKSPLFIVQGFLDLLTRTKLDRLDEEGRGYVEAALRGSYRMNALIDDLLAYSRAGRLSDDVRPVDLGELVDRVIDELAPARKQSRGRVERGELPVVRGDQLLLGQLLHNLVANGLKFARDGVPPEVLVSATREGDSWSVTVTDNGIGIPADDRERVFAMFTRLHGQDEYPGTGIGLAICQRVVESHGGRIWATDGVDGGGSRFVFTLPA